MQNRTVEQSGHMPVPQIAQEIVEGAQTIPQEGISERVVERIVVVPVPQIREEIGEVIQLIQQGRISDRVVEQVVDASVREIREQIVEVVKVFPQERLQQGTEEQIADLPVVMQAKVPAVQVAQKPIEIPPIVVRHQRTMVIDDVAQEAQKYRGEDKVDKAKIDAKNCWENHCVNVRNTHAEEKLEVKFEAGDKEQAVQDALERLVKNQLAEKEEFQAEQETEARQPHSSKQQPNQAGSARERK